jgi:spore coat protein CotF
MGDGALTTKELGFVEECVKLEVLCEQKLRIYERQTEDAELRDIFRRGQDTARRHVDELLSLLR